MFKDFFNFKRPKTLSESIVFYCVLVTVYLVLSAAAEQYFDLRF